MRKRLSIILSIALPVLLQAGAMAQESSGIIVTRLPFSSPASSEISPVMTADGIIFCSDRRTSGVTDRTSFDNRRLYKIFFSGMKDSTWSKPVEIKNERTDLFNNGPFCIAPDKKTIFFTSEIETGAPSKSRKFRNHSGIFTGELSGNEILAIKPFKYNNPAYNIGQPSISPDGRYLFFSSDMPGGQGGSDIYYCEFINNDWSAPVNAGSQVNSAGADNYPFIHQTGRLYFSSDREGGSGGLDIYSSVKTGDKWNEPVRLPDPVNSSADDFAYTSRADMLEGFFSSNRRRDDDIYEFVATIIRKTNCDTLQENNYCYEFLEENAVKYDSIPFRYNWRFGDGETAMGRRVEHCYSKPGSYLVQLDVVNLVTKETIANEKSSMLEVQAIEQPWITGPDKAFAGEALKFSADSTNLPGWEVTRYYWNFEDETVAEGEDVNKTFRQPGQYNIQLIVSAKPAADGTAREACVSRKIIISGKQ